jgi:hypothetical protein
MSKPLKNKPVEKTAPNRVVHENKVLVFTRENYYLMIASAVVIVLGFALMYGDDQDIYSTRRITIAPVTVLLGFVLGIVAIMYKPKPKA